MINIFKIIIYSKWIFKKPNEKNVLVYDSHSEEFAKIFFLKKNYEILNVRYESINIYVLFVTFLKSGIKNLQDNYKKNYMEFVSPKIVLTAIDNNPAFYKLKNIYDKPYYISFQNGQRDNKFYNECKSYIKETKENLRADFIFLFNEVEKKKLSKVIKSKIYVTGNVKNNHYSIKNKIRDKITNIMYVSQHRPNISFLETDKKIFNYLINFCKKRNIKLSFCTPQKKEYEVFFRNNLNRGDWIFYHYVNPRKTYTNLNKQQMVVFNYSSLGFEALAKGIKCVSFAKSFPTYGYKKKYPKSGPFWTNSLNYHDMNKIILRIFNLKNLKWKKISKKYSHEILNYDPNNSIAKKTIREILKK